jgi:GNAT superfamily N-acetyltransferase
VAAVVEIRPLAPSDDRGGFSCGQPDLDRFLVHYAGQNQFRLHVAVTYVASLEGIVAGYATVTTGTIARDSIPDARLARRLPAYPLPVVRLARLATDRRARGKGIGAALLRHVFVLAVAQQEVVGCVGVVTDAKPEAIAFYERYGAVRLRGLAEGQVHGAPLQLIFPLATVRAALG